MTITVLFDAKSENWAIWEAPLRTAFAEAGLDCDLRREADPANVDYVIYAPHKAPRDFAPFTRLNAVLSLWAGVETIIGNPTLTVPLARMVDPGMTEGMTEWVVGHVLRHHLGMDAQIHGLKGQWTKSIPPLARERKVTILGQGVLGSDAARALAQLNFDVIGWSRRPKANPVVPSLHGPDGLSQALGRAEILVLLLPLTSDTELLMNADRLAQMPKGAVIINPGRGPLIDDDALLAALDSNQISHATLDVFRIEPLPPAHPFWSHARITVTPHIASETRPSTAAKAVADNMRRCEDGAPMLNVADPSQGY